MKKLLTILIMSMFVISFSSAYFESFWNQNGNSLPISGTDAPSITSLNSTRIAFIDSYNRQLRTYDWNGTNWNQNGNSLTLSSIGTTISTTSLNATRIAFIDNYKRQLRTYDWNGTDWSQTGNSLSMGGGTGNPSITSLNSTRIAFIDGGSDKLRTYDWNETDWSQTGNSLSISNIETPSITSLSSTRIAFIDQRNKQLRTYDWNGTNWNQNGNSLTLSSIGTTISTTSLNATRIAFIDNYKRQLRTYDWNGTDWSQTGNSLSISGTGFPSITSLNSTRIAFIDSYNRQLRTYDWIEKSGTITLNYPTALIDYGKLNGTLQLSFTATDQIDTLLSLTSDFQNISFPEKTLRTKLKQFCAGIDGCTSPTLELYDFDLTSCQLYDADTYSVKKEGIQVGLDYYYNYSCYKSTGNIGLGLLEAIIPLDEYYEDYSFDSTLDKVWYNYNGTNVTIVGAVSGVYNISNITLSTKKNVTIYANDTVGNLKAEVFGWDYKVFETGQEYSPITRAGSVESYALNVTLSSGIDLTSGKLIYAGQELTANIYTSGSDRRLLVANFETPLYTIDTNASFYWDLTITGGSVQTQNNTQLVQAVLIDNCSTHTYKLFNLSLFDERTKSSLRGDIEINYQLLNKPTYGVINSVLLNLKNVSNSSICSGINLSGENIAYSAEIRYTSEGYASEFYNIQRADIGTGVQQLKLYDLNLNYSTEFKIVYQDDDYTFVEGAVVQLQRKYISEGIYEIVEAPLTSNEGTAIVHIDLDSNKYKATIVKNGQVLDVFDNLVFKCQSALTGECTQQLLGSINPQNDVNLESILDFAYTNPLMLNDTISLSFSIPSGSPSTVGLVLIQKDQFGNQTLCNRTITSSAGSIECDFDKTIGDSFIELYVTKNGELVLETTYIVPEDGKMDFLGNNFFIVLVMLLSLVGMAFTSPEWIIINGVITFLIAGSLWLLNGLQFVVGLGALMWLVVASAILIFKIAKQEDR